MKKFLLTILAVAFIGMQAFSQMVSPVTWKYTIDRTSETEAVIQLKATIQDGWHLYAINSGDGFELPLSIKFDKSNDYQLVGKITEPKYKVSYDSAMGTHSNYFSKQATFKQKIKILSKDKKFTIQGSVAGQACVEGRCTQVSDEFRIVVSPDGTKIEEETDTASVVGDSAKETVDTPAIQQQPATLTAQTAEKEKE